MSLVFKTLTSQTTAILYEESSGERSRIGSIDHAIKKVFFNYVGCLTDDELIVILEKIKDKPTQ